MGFALLLFFGFARTIVRAGLIPQLTRAGGYSILSRILLYGFLLALAIIALGFGLKYRELSRAEQARAVDLIRQELVGNLAVVGELQQNIATIEGVTDALSEVLRHPGIPIMSGIFPADNLDPKKHTPPSLDYSRALLQQLKASGLLENEVERAKFNQAAQAVSGTIERTKGALYSISDPENTRYAVKSDMWNANLPILRKIDIISVPRMQALYQEIDLLRADYNVTVAYSLAYVEALDALLGGEDRNISNHSLAAVLASERLFVETESAFSESISRRLSEISIAIGQLAV
jgi:hypothetical protein